MRKNSFKPLKKASLASVVGLSVFTYMGTVEANDEIEENLISEEVVVEAEVDEVVTENNVAEEVVEEADIEVENQPIEEISQDAGTEDVSQESNQVETAPAVEEEIEIEQVENTPTEETVANESTEDIQVEVEETIDEIVAEELAVSEDVNEASSAEYDQQEDVELVETNESEVVADEEDIVEEAEQVITDDLSQNYINHISIFDNQSSQLLTNVSFIGRTFQDRLNNVIGSINNDYGTNYSIVDQIFTGKETSGVQVNNYSNIFTSHSYDIYAENQSEISYPFENRPFIPNHQMYDDYYVNFNELMEINIIDPYGNYLFEGQTTDFYTIDGVIRDAMSNIDEDEYYYMSVDVSNGLMFSTYYRGEYKSIDVYVGSKSYDSIQEELPEETEQGFDSEIPEYEYPSFEDFPSEYEEPTFEFPEIELPEIEFPEMDFNEEDFELPEIDFNHDGFELPEFDFNPSFPSKETDKVTSPEQNNLVESVETAQEDSNASNTVEIDQVATESVSKETAASAQENVEIVEEQIISGVIAPNTRGTITLADGSTYTIESDGEGYWSITVPTVNELVSVEEVVVTFEEADSKETSELTATVENININEASSEQVTEERLPETGEANSNKGLLAATAGLLGGLLLFVTGRRKSTK